MHSRYRTTYAGDDRIHRALEAGASAYLLQYAVTNVLLEAIRKVHGGGWFVDSAVAAELAQRSMSDRLFPIAKSKCLR